LEILADSHAPLNKYHRLLFRMTNTGEVPLKNLQMGVLLSENLWHRFGNSFGFTEKDLEVGEVREALLHVKTLKDGAGIIQAKLTTDEGADSTAAVSFAIGNARPIETKPAVKPTTPSTAPARLVPTFEIGETPIKPAPRELPDNAKPVTPEAKPLIPAEETTEPTPVKPAVPLKEKPVPDDFPAFPGELEPLPPKTEENKPPREAPIPAKKDPVKQPDPFEIPVKQEPVEDLFKADR
ncbi:MAG TPA: hypothetical protein VMM56_00295, partial [Planctomycetaceae bacterium]|nr:hypothetical protein [Planctomycetaceae bacterium]